MNLRKSFLVLAVMVLAACRGEKANVTGGYGAGVLSGQVVMQGVASSSPAGVEVSVRGTGMTAVLGTDGQFLFSGVPEGADLDFRRADGIAASLRLEKTSGSVMIALSQNSASHSGRRRSVSRSRGEVYEIEGTLVSAASDQIVVTTRAGEITVGLTAETIIASEGGSATAADLLAGARVHVKAGKSGDAYVALKIILGGESHADDRQHVMRETEGTVVTASAAQLVVFSSKKIEVTFVITPETVVTRGGAPVDPATLPAGTRVHVRSATEADGTVTALLVIAQDGEGGDGGEEQEEVEIRGTVLSVGATDLVVETAGGSVTVQTDGATTIRRQGTTITLADVVAGDAVEVEGAQVDPTTILARRISVEHREDEGEEVEVNGTVVSVGTSDLVVAASSGNVTVQTNASTRIRRRGQTIPLSAIVAGDQVEAEGTAVDATTILARKISVEG